MPPPELVGRGGVIARAAVSLAELDASFFRVRFHRLAPAERRYMRAMAELGSGPHRSGDVAGLLGKKVTTVAEAHRACARMTIRALQESPRAAFNL
jgi:hypothetical protein